MQLTERMSHKKVVALKNENITIAFNRLSRGRRKAFLPFSNLSFYCFILTFFQRKFPLTEAQSDCMHVSSR